MNRQDNMHLFDLFLVLILKLGLQFTMKCLCHCIFAMFLCSSRICNCSSGHCLRCLRGLGLSIGGKGCSSSFMNNIAIFISIYDLSFSQTMLFSCEPPLRIILRFQLVRALLLSSDLQSEWDFEFIILIIFFDFGFPKMILMKKGYQANLNFFLQIYVNL